MVVPFQDRGHGMTTERRTMTFFCARCAALSRYRYTRDSFCRMRARMFQSGRRERGRREKYSLVGCRPPALRPVSKVRAR